MQKQKKISTESSVWINLRGTCMKPRMTMTAVQSIDTNWLHLSRKLFEKAIVEACPKSTCQPFCMQFPLSLSKIIVSYMPLEKQYYLVFARMKRTFVVVALANRITNDADDENNHDTVAEFKSKSLINTPINRYLCDICPFHCSYKYDTSKHDTYRYGWFCWILRRSLPDDHYLERLSIMLVDLRSPLDDFISIKYKTKNNWNTTKTSDNIAAICKKKSYYLGDLRVVMGGMEKILYLFVNNEKKETILIIHTCYGNSANRTFRFTLLRCCIKFDEIAAKIELDAEKRKNTSNINIQTMWHECNLDVNIKDINSTKNNINYTTYTCDDWSKIFEISPIISKKLFGLFNSKDTKDEMKSDEKQIAFEDNLLKSQSSIIDELLNESGTYTFFIRVNGNYNINNINNIDENNLKNRLIVGYGHYYKQFVFYDCFKNQIAFYTNKMTKSSKKRKDIFFMFTSHHGNKMWVILRRKCKYQPKYILCKIMFKRYQKTHMTMVFEYQSVIDLNFRRKTRREIKLLSDNQGSIYIKIPPARVTPFYEEPRVDVWRYDLQKNLSQSPYKWYLKKSGKIKDHLPKNACYMCLVPNC